jgi:hypothetical protein
MTQSPEVISRAIAWQDAQLEVLKQRSFDELNSFAARSNLKSPEEFSECRFELKRTNGKNGGVRLELSCVTPGPGQVDLSFLNVAMKPKDRKKMERRFGADVASSAPKILEMRTTKGFEKLRGGQIIEDEFIHDPED